MKYKGKITDPKDLVTKEYADGKIPSTTSILKGDGSGNAVATETESATLLSVVSTPTEGSSNLITSGGVYSAVNAITEQYADAITNVATTGSGNAVTAVTASDGVLTVTKDSTFLTSHQDISMKEAKGYLTIGGTTYQLRIGTSGAAGYITIEVE